MRILFINILSLATFVTSCAQDFNTRRISDHIRTLASDDFQGRGTRHHRDNNNRDLLTGQVRFRFQIAPASPACERFRFKVKSLALP